MGEAEGEMMDSGMYNAPDLGASTAMLHSRLRVRGVVMYL